MQPHTAAGAPSNGSRQPTIRPEPPISVSERLFGVRSLVVVGLYVVAIGANLFGAVSYPSEDHRFFQQALLFTAILLNGSRDHRVQAVAMGIIAAMIWLYVDTNPAIVLMGTALTIAIEFAHGTISSDLQASAARQPKSELQARISASIALQVASVITFAAPAGLAVYQFLNGSGPPDMWTAALLLPGVALCGVLTFRRLRDFRASFVGTRPR